MEGLCNSRDGWRGSHRRDGGDGVREEGGIQQTTPCTPAFIIYAVAAVPAVTSPPAVPAIQLTYCHKLHV